ncbi:hypothetical protein IJ579_03370 [bacterium]|nr:hypothetical protein [bacterium]
MDIHAITPLFYPKRSQNTQNSHNSTVMRSKLNTLNADTVSFGASPSGAMAKFSDYLEQSISIEVPRLERIATTYLDVLEAVALKLKDFGFTFDRAYCELNPVKSPKSYTSKVVRSKTLRVPDTIRATLYCNDPYDLSKIFEGLLPEMSKRGYVVANTEMPVADLMKRGYIPSSEELKDPKKIMKVIPDLDFRLDEEMIADQVSRLPQEYSYAVAKPQKSGYEDIQMRFVRDYDKKRNLVYHELIILFGPHTAQAKHEESELVYSILRKFNEFNMKFDSSTVGTNSFKTNRYIEMVQDMFRGKISQKLFANAKNKDYSGIDYQMPIVFSPESINLLENAFGSIRKGLNIAYKEARKSAKSETRLSELIKEHRQDSALLTEIYKNLMATIKHYNKQAGV